MGLLVTACLLACGLLAASGFGIWFARVSFLRSLGWLAVHLALLGAGHYIVGVPAFLLMFCVPLLFSMVLGIAAGTACASGGSGLARLAPLGASLPATLALNVVAILIHLDELGRPLGDNGLLYVFAQLVLGVPLQFLLLFATFMVTAARARSSHPS